MTGNREWPVCRASSTQSRAEAERRLTVAHDYWCATVCPDGRPHVMPVWGVWLGGRMYDPVTLNEVATGTSKRSAYWWESAAR